MQKLVQHEVVTRVTEVGRSRIVIRCPFCKACVVAYTWSLAGSGKRCGCGAMHYRTGTRAPVPRKRK
jgi:hypothetical protein